MAVSGFDVAVLLTPRVRRWLYGVGAAVTALLGMYGLLDAELIAGWNVALAALLGVAFVNVPASEGEADGEDLGDGSDPVGFVLPE